LARALLVGCGCRARAAGALLLEDGWQVRGTTRDPARAGEIERAGLEPAIADPDRVATVTDHVADVAVVAWLMASARGEPGGLAVLNGPRLERLCEELVDTPVRGIVYEAAGSVAGEALAEGRRVVDEASRRWRIRVEVVEHDPGDHAGWALAAAAECARLVAAPGRG
jgi:nucleoside-diphosphate-sugar epimerase